MFNLEQSITEWQQRMLASGIPAPEPLVELENHLREEIERQMKSGTPEPEAFETAIREVGQPAVLRKEFACAGGLPGWLGADSPTRVNRILGALWMADSLWGVNDFTNMMGDFLYFRVLHPMNLTSPRDVLMQFELAMNVAGVIAGFCLFRGAKLGRWSVWILALLGMIDFALDLGGTSWTDLKAAPFNFYFQILLEEGLLLTSLWLLCPSQKTKLVGN